MNEWRCLALTAEGNRDWRRVIAHDARHAAAQLADEGLLALEVRSGAPTLLEILNRPIGGSVGSADQALILTQLTMLLRAGVPLDRSLDLLREQMPRSSQRAYLAEVLSRVRSGDRLAAALACRPVFPAYVTGVVAAAERSGQLTDAIDLLAGRMRDFATARRELITALTYPIAVLAATMLALVIVVTIVIPQFEPLFAGQEARLPWVTQAVLGFSTTMREQGFVVLGVLLLVALLTILVLRSGSGEATLARVRHRIPGMGLRDQFLGARFATLLGTLLESGVTLVAALPLAREALGSRRWRDWCAAIERRLREGQLLSAAMRHDPLLSSAAIRLAEVGEQGGRLGEALGEAGRIMHTSAKARIDRIVALANPIAIMLLGGLVAFLVGGVMLGIFALGDFAG